MPVTDILFGILEQPIEEVKDSLIFVGKGFEEWQFLLAVIAQQLQPRLAEEDELELSKEGGTFMGWSSTILVTPLK